MEHSELSKRESIVPPFNFQTATQKIKIVEEAWNTTRPESVLALYTKDTEWHDRAQFIKGIESARQFLMRKWAKELNYCLRNRLWGFHENQIAIWSECEWRDNSGKAYLSTGGELWEFDENGLIRKRHTSAIDAPLFYGD